ncbi:trypsin-like serine peptidase [Sphaerimonospora mesophila]|uniref:trypsin-like serine peptidase n=1 Tax=Sphaerimonospora mesophila TaxID=37483 RepID=UPI0006E3FEB9
MKRTLTFGGVVAATGLLAAGLGAPAQAADSVADVNLANTPYAAWQVVDFWFKENAANLINAKPYAVETTIPAKHVSGGGPAADTKPGVVPAIGDEKKTASKSKNVNLPKSTGKVFFRGSDGQPHWCTATSVQSTYRNVVATAGHCVYDTVTNKATLDSWIFVPGYYQGKTPWGIYVGKTAYTHYDFDVYEDGDRDYAFVTVYNGVNRGAVKRASDLTDAEKKIVAEAGPGKPHPFIHFKWKGTDLYQFLTDAGRLGDNVGGQGLAYNQKLGKNVFVFGYPSGSHPDGNHAYSGKTLKWSYGKTFAAQAPAIKAEELQGIKSSFTGEGSSGSAWLLQYKSAKRIGYLNGVTIGVSDTDGNKRIDTSVSPYFDGETYGVYKAAAANWSGKIV